MEIKTFVLGSGTNYGFFTTVDTDGAPITLAGTPSLACNVNGAVAATAGLTLSVDYDSVTGRHRVAVDVDNATLALADGDSVDVYIAAGTVDSVSVVGQSVLKFVATDGSLLAQTSTDVQTAAAAAITAAGLATAAALATVDSELGTLATDIGANGAGLTALPWNAAWDAEVQSEVTDALNAAALATAANLATVSTATTAIQAVTDQFTFSAAGFVDANVMEVNDNGGLTGDGGTTPIDQA